MRTISRLLVMVVMAGSATLWAAGGVLPGGGTEGDPYLIEDLADFDRFAGDPNYWDDYTRLETDVDLDGRTYTTAVIAPDTPDTGNWFDGTPFTGVFDGDGHVISNLTIDTAGAGNYYLGLFGKISGSNAKVKDTGMENINITGHSKYLGGLCGDTRDGTITNCYATGSVTGVGRSTYLGGLCGFNSLATITNCYATVSVSSGDNSNALGVLCGNNNGGTISNCYATGSVTGGEGSYDLGGLCGNNEHGMISNCYATGSVTGGEVSWRLGGLCGWNGYDLAMISNCYATGSVTGGDGSYELAGLCGVNYYGTITNCYSSGSVTGGDGSGVLGGLYGRNSYGTISNCYATGSVTGDDWLGGMGGYNEFGTISNCFWDIETGGPDNGFGTPLPTAQMQMGSTFIDAGWDFDTPVWAIDEGVDYPRFWWPPVLHGEPEVTLGTSNGVSWDPVVGSVKYYVECGEDPNFTSIVSDSGWIVETSCEFIGLQSGQRYWYRVKAKNAAGVESGWSNVESSLQSTLADAVDVLLDPVSLKNKNMKNSLLNKMDAAIGMIDAGLYEDALDKLRNDILAKTNGCAEVGEPDKNDWIITCEGQSQVYGLVMETIEYVRSLLE